MALFVYLAGSINTPVRGASSNDQSVQVILNEIMYHQYSQGNQAEDISAEYIELFNQGAQSISLAGWQLTNGVNFIFPDIILDAGEYLVIAANMDTFTSKYPGITNVVGGWDGKLSNSGEVIELVDSTGEKINSVRYADQGDWGIRELGPRDRGHRGWDWISEHDGGGKSLELINPALPNEYGQNWMASNSDEGTPGMINSAGDNDIAPLILDVTHFPIVPDSNDAVTITTRIFDELQTGINVTLYYRIDFSTYRGEDIYALYDPKFYIDITMFDDGAHGDGGAGDGVYSP